MADKKTGKNENHSTLAPLKSRMREARQYLTDKQSGAKHRSFSLTGKYAAANKADDVSGGIALFKQTALLYWCNRKLLVGLSLIYMLVLWFIIGLPSQQAYGDLRDILAETSENGIRNLSGISALAVGAVSGFTAAAQSELQQFLSALTGVIFWLVFVWAVRHLHAGNEVTIKKALYNALTPLIPLLAVMLLVALQSLPASLGILILSYAFGGAAIVSGAEAMLFSVAAGLLIVLSLYWLLQSLFALLIVTLPNTYPLAAMSSAKALVTDRRLLILRRLVVLVLIVGLAWLCILFPIVLIDIYANTSFVPLVPMTVDLLSAVTLPVVIIYTYRLYRELL